MKIRPDNFWRINPIFRFCLNVLVISAAAAARIRNQVVPVSKKVLSFPN